MSVESDRVVDASVALKWVVAEHESEAALALLDRPLHAPDLLIAECVNALWKKVVRREVPKKEIRLFGSAIEAIDVNLHPTRTLAARSLELAVELDHPGYDYLYLALAERLDVPLVTADRRLLDKVTAAGGGDLRRLILPLGST